MVDNIFAKEGKRESGKSGRVMDRAREEGRNVTSRRRRGRGQHSSSSNKLEDTLTSSYSSRTFSIFFLIPFVSTSLPFSPFIFPLIFFFIQFLSLY